MDLQFLFLKTLVYVLQVGDTRCTLPIRIIKFLYFCKFDDHLRKYKTKFLKKLIVYIAYKTPPIFQVNIQNINHRY